MSPFGSGSSVIVSYWQRRRRDVLGLASALAVATVAEAQRQPAGIRTLRSALQSPELVADSVPTAPRSSWWAPAVSLVVPGTGQAALRQQRAFGYLAAEAFLLVQWIASRRDGGDGRAAYRRIAREVARSPFGGPLPDGPWSYYESMERFRESGVYNAGTGSQFVPEANDATYNGRQWLLARETFWRDPTVAPAVSSTEYQRALEFYRRRAVTSEYRWSWANAELQQDEYRQRIRRSNASYRAAAEWGGLLLANHLLSTVDAFVSVRLRRFGVAAGPTRSGTPGPMGAGGLGTGIEVRVPLVGLLR
jgi:hypothetical protein